MNIETKNFGILEVQDAQKIRFPQGIPGFEELTEYILIEDEDENSPFCYLQSVQDGAICFVITNPFVFKKDYSVSLPDEEKEKLGGGTEENFKVFSIVTVLKNFESATINLIAPLIIQEDTRLGMQWIMSDANYTTRHLLKDLLKEGVEGEC